MIDTEFVLGDLRGMFSLRLVRHNSYEVNVYELSMLFNRGNLIAACHGSHVLVHVQVLESAVLIKHINQWRQPTKHTHHFVPPEELDSRIRRLLTETLSEMNQMQNDPNDHDGVFADDADGPELDDQDLDEIEDQMDDEDLDDEYEDAVEEGLIEDDDEPGDAGSGNPDAA